MRRARAKIVRQVEDPHEPGEPLPHLVGGRLELLKVTSLEADFDAPSLRPEAGLRSRSRT